MPIRLLPKYEIDRHKAEEQRQRMQEGLQVAERVDTLRETLASEEMAFEKYRTDRLKTIQEEISIREQERDKLDVLISKAKIEHSSLIAPLDIEWANVEKFKTELTLKENSLREKETSLESKDSFLTKRENEIVEKEKLTDTQHLSATSHTDRAKALFEQTKIESEKIKIDLQFREKELSDKEISFETIQNEFVNQRDTITKTLSEKEIELNDREQEVKNEWVRINDQRKTLERAFARLKK